MIEFKKNIKKLLPYNRREYLNYLSDDEGFYPSTWYGISIQFKSDDKRDNLKEYVTYFAPLFKNIVAQFDNGSPWIANHAYKGYKWFVNKKKNLIRLRSVFKRNNIPNTFDGAVTFTEDDLLKFSKHLISYPIVMPGKKGRLYQDIDVSHGELPIIIKISGHMNIDVLSTNKKFLRQVVKENSSDVFIIKKYRSTSL